MLRFSKMADYALVIMAYFSQKETSLHTTVGISAATGLSTATVSKIVKTLTKAGLLRSVRGAAGGYQLARAATCLSVADIVEAMDGPVRVSGCLDHGSLAHEFTAACRLHNNLERLNGKVRDTLVNMSLADFSRPEVGCPTSTALNMEAPHA